MNYKLITAAVLTLLGAGTAVAIPADPSPKQVRQADGTTVTVHMRGDEFWHQLYTDDGQTVRWNPQTRMLEPDTRTEADYRQAMQKRQTVQARYAEKLCRHLSYRDGKGPRKLRMNDFPTTGKSKSLVFLIEFSDTKFTSIDDPKDYYTRMLNERGFTWNNGARGSAMDFYDQSSNYLFDHEFVVVGPITLDHEATWYGSDTPTQDVRAGQMVVDACKKVDDEIDFSEYDYDNDGYVDNIYLFYAGIGQATHPNAVDYIWPHSADLDSDWNIHIAHDGKNIRHYATSNELRYTNDGSLIPLGIGVFVHEFGHVLGLMDHYDVSYSPINYNIGTWDTMAAGSYNDNMNCPPLFSAFERGELGWLDYTELTADADSINVLRPLTPSNLPPMEGAAYRWSVPGTNGREFFVLENRQQVGFDASLPGHGLLVWHIDIDTLAWQRNTLNVTYGHPRVGIVCADRAESDATRAGDPFPGTQGVTQFDFEAWEAGHMFSFDDVVEHEDGMVEFLLAGTAYQMPQPTDITPVNVQDSSFQFTWSEVYGAQYYQVSVKRGDIYLDGYKEAWFDTPATVTISGVPEREAFTVSVQAVRGNYFSDWTTRTITTEETPFSRRRPQNLTATDATADGFTAHWDAVEGADDYLVTLFENSFGTQLKTMGYDFTDKADGLPALWTTSSSTYYSVNGYYGAASPSLRFSRNDDFIEIAWPEARIRQLQFWMRSSSSTGRLHVEQWGDDEWQTKQTFDLSNEATTVKVSLDDTERARLRYERASGYVAIDDIVAQCTTMERQPVSGQQEISTGGELSHVFSQLEPQQYSFRVCAVRQGERSAWSDECQVGVEHVDTICLGYCNGEVATQTDLQMNGTGWAHVAMRLPASTLAAYEDNTIEAVRVYLLSRANIDSLIVWVRSDLDGDNLAEGLITSKSAQRIEKGWNEVVLDKPYAVAATELFVGFSYRQRANVKAVSVVGDPLYDTFYMRYGQADWQDISQLGAVSMEAVIVGSNILQHDLGLTTASMSPDLTHGANALQVVATVQNFGSKAVEGFDITCEAAGLEPITTHFAEKLASTESRRLTFVITPPVFTDQDTEWTLTLDADDNEANNALTATYAFLKNVIVEEFTTELCVNCPRVATYLHLALESNHDYDNRVFAICHHAGYYTDWLTQDWDEQLTWLYNEGSSLYAPAVMLNRHAEFDAQYNYGQKTPCFIPSSNVELTQYFDYEMQQTANAVVGLTLDFNADSTQVTASVSLLRNQRYTAAHPRLTVYLLEDDIRAENQIGADGIFLHQHVTRATNQTWGEPVAWTADNRFDYTTTFDLKPTWVREKMHVVAFLHNYDGEDHTAIDIENSACTPLLGSAANAVTSVAGLQQQTEQVYTLQGRCANNAARGLVIVRRNDGSVVKQVVR